MRRPIAWLAFLALAVLALLAGRLLLQSPDQVRAQTTMTIGGDAANTIPENLHVVLVLNVYFVTGADPAYTFTWSLEGVDATHFGLTLGVGDSSATSIVHDQPFDYEVPDDDDGNNIYHMTLKAVNDTTSESATLPITVEVTNVNEAPTISESDASYTIDEKTPTSMVIATFTASDEDADTVLTWTLGGPDAEDFAIVDGELRFKNVPDFEMPFGSSNGYVLSVTVTDDGATPLSASTRVFLVWVANVNEPGKVEFEGAASEGQQLTATVTDEDGLRDIPNVQWQWARGSAAAGPFTDFSGATSIGSVTSSSYTLAADDVAQYIKATAVYGDGHSPGNVFDKSESAVSGQVAAGMTISGDTANTTPENLDTAILNDYSVTDADESHTFTWSLEGVDATHFIHGTGHSSTSLIAHGKRFDYEDPDDDDGNNIYHMTLKAVNNTTSESATLPITVEVTNVNERPFFTNTLIGQGSFHEDRDPAVVAVEYAAADPDAGTTFAWTLEGDDGHFFTITEKSGSNTQAELRFGASPDFEMAADHDENNRYEVTVKATDNGILADRTNTTSVTHELTIFVINVNEPGMVELMGTLSGGAQLTAELTDPDGEPTDLTWQWARGSTAMGTFTDIGGATDANYTTVAADVERYLRATASYDDPVSTAGSPKRTASAVSGPVAAGTMTISGDTAPTTPENTSTFDVRYDVTPAPDDSDTLVCSVEGDDVNAFFFAEDTRADQCGLFHRVQFDYEDPKDSDGKNTYDMTLKAVNETTSESATLPITVTVTNVNEAPTISGPTVTAPTTWDGVFQFTVEENTPASAAFATYTASDPDGDSLTWSLEGFTGEKFGIVENPAGSGQWELSFGKLPDYEDPDGLGFPDATNEYYVIVTVTDDGMPEMSASTVSLTVDIVNLNEPGKVEFEGAASEGQQLTATVTDEDGLRQIPNVQWQWARGSAAAGPFTDFSGATSIGSVTSSSYTLAADDVAQYIKATAVYGDGHSPGNVFDKSESAVSRQVAGGMTISGDTAPTTPENATTFDVRYDVTPAPDPTETLVCSVEGDDVNEGVNVIFYAVATQTDECGLYFTVPFDYEDPKDSDGKNTYDMTLKAVNETTSESATLPITVTVTNVNEAPTLSAPTVTAPTTWNGFFNFVVEENTPNTTAIATYTASDPDGDTLTWSLESADSEDFEIVDGELRFETTPDFEDPVDTSNTYFVIVTVTDDGAPPMSASTAGARCRGR